MAITCDNCKKEKTLLTRTFQGYHCLDCIRIYKIECFTSDQTKAMRLEKDVKKR